VSNLQFVLGVGAALLIGALWAYLRGPKG